MSWIQLVMIQIAINAVLLTTICLLDQRIKKLEIRSTLSQIKLVYPGNREELLFEEFAKENPIRGSENQIRSAR